MPKFVHQQSDGAVLEALRLYNQPIFEGDQYRGPEIQRLNARLINDFVVDRRRAFIAKTESNDTVAVACYDGRYRMRGCALIERLVVADAVRGQGVGRFMIDNLAQTASEQGLEALRLRALQDSMGFYAHLGFVCDEIVPEYAEIPYMRLDIKTRSPRRSQANTSLVLR